MKYDKLRTLTDAAEHARKGRLDQAIGAYRKIIEHQPDEMRARLKIGDLLVRKNEPEEATHTYLVVAEHYADHGFERKASAIFRRVIELQPDRLDIHLQLAESLQAHGQPEDAREVLTAALEVLDVARAPDLIATLSAMVQLDPDNVAVRLRLADLFAARGQSVEAREELERAAGLLRASGQTEAFLWVSQKRLAQHPENVPLRRELAGVYLRQDHPQRALALLRECYAPGATEPATLTLFTKIFGAMERQPETVAAWKALAEAYDRVGQQALRDKALQKIRTLDPDDQAADSNGSMDLAEAIDSLVSTEWSAEQVELPISDLTLTAHQTPVPASTFAEPANDTRDTSDLAALLEPNWLERELVVDLD